MVDNASRRGAVDLGVILMVAAFAVIGGFLFWLRGQSEAELALRIVEDTVTVDDAPIDTSPDGATIVTAADLQAGAGAYQGQLVRIASIPVASNLGQQGFWLDLPSGPLLVSLSASMIADETAVTAGSTVTVTGTVMAMSDSVSTSWLQAGRIGEGDQLAASFASHFIEATRIETAGGGGGSR
jgi:hypothetical protein